MVVQQCGLASAACYSDKDFDQIRDDPAIKALHLVLPTATAPIVVGAAGALFPTRLQRATAPW